MQAYSTARKAIEIPRTMDVRKKFDTRMLPSLEETVQAKSHTKKEGKRKTPRKKSLPKEFAREEIIPPGIDDFSKPRKTAAKMTPAPGTELPSSADLSSMAPPAEKKTKDDDARLVEIRRQIEIEIREAVKRKKRSGKHSNDQKKKYLKLLQELKDSYKHGGISKENYVRLRKKYEDKISKIDGDF